MAAMLTAPACAAGAGVAARPARAGARPARLSMSSALRGGASLPVSLPARRQARAHAWRAAPARAHAHPACRVRCKHRSSALLSADSLHR
jgi:hypothetical protein